jgi:hypothetical protein
MTTQTKHTPTLLEPWKETYSRSGAALEGDIPKMRMEGDACADVLVVSLGATPEQTMQYARDIRRACNSYDALVEALGEAETYLQGYALASSSQRHALGIVQKALAVAQVQP